MPFVRVSWWSGRSTDDTAKVATAITEALSSVGVAPEATSIVFEDVSRDDWYIAGIPASKRAPQPR